MPRTSRALAVSILSVAMLLPAVAGIALARTNPGTSSTTGNDISWPQCGGSYPTGQAFGIVGVTGGLANDQNPCLASELAWAARSTGKSAPGAVAKAQLYVNTADPSPAVADWPTNDVDPTGATVSDPYGTCTGGDDQACAWQYGWDRATQDALWLEATSGQGFSNVPGTYWWWLDVETANTWETGSSGLANNIADLEGMVAALGKAGVTTIGIYSTSYQWGQITGGAGVGTGLGGLPDWIPGARTLSGAQANCSLVSFTGGRVLMTQWFGKPFDGDYACSA